jgi:hypothetical protein
MSEAEADTIDSPELQLAATAHADTELRPAVQASAEAVLPAPHAGDSPIDGLNGSPWAALRAALRQQVTTAVNSGGVPIPLGRWLAEDLVLAADKANNGTARRASTTLGMAETTFRRRLEKVKREAQAGLIARQAATSLPAVGTAMRWPVRATRKPCSSSRNASASEP